MRILACMCTQVYVVRACECMHIQLGTREIVRVCTHGVNMCIGECGSMCSHMRVGEHTRVQESVDVRAHTREIYCVRACV